MPAFSSNTTATADVVIIGGGVIGLTIARALARRDVREVIVVEKNQFSREASWAAGGILAPQIEADRSDDFFRLACASRDLYPSFAQALQDESRIDIELDTTGTLYVAFSAEEETELRSRYVWQQSQGLSVEWLDADAACRIEPCLSKKVRCGLRFPEDYQVENRKLCEALIIANQRLGVHLIDHCEARRLQLESGKMRGVQTSNGFLSAPTVVIAAGAWSSRIDAPESVQIEPVRGQMLCFDAPRFARHVIYNSRGYLIPRRDGRLLAGSTSEQVGFDKRVTDDGISSIKSMAMEIAPAIANLLLVDSWAGLRPWAKDDLPVLGPAKEIKGLCYATGHYRNGILLAPITGELIADAIVGNQIPSLLAPLSQDRFVSEARPSGEGVR